MALLKYTVLRLAVFVVVAAGLYLVGVRNLWVNALLAILISGAISLVLLDRVRNEAGLSVSRIWQSLESATTAEDAADDAARSAGGIDADGSVSADGTDATRDGDAANGEAEGPRTSTGDRPA
jgi:hypothetical protein